MSDPHGIRPPTTGVATDEVFRVEAHGMDQIPDTDRHGGPRDLFWVWFGANLTFTFVINGALVIGLGLRFWEAVAIFAVGNLAFFLVGAASVAGARAGAPTLVVARASFGRWGNYPAAVLNWLVSVGYIILNTVVGVLALAVLGAAAGLGTGAPVLVAGLVVMIACTASVAVLGHATVQVMQRWLAIGLVVCTVVLGVLVLPQADLSYGGTDGSRLWAWSVGLLVAVAGGPLSYIAICADFTRYLPRASRARGITLATGFGAMVPATVLGVIGIAAATRVEVVEATDPVTAVATLLPVWFQVPFLAVVVGGCVTNTIMTLYSSGLNLQILGVPLNRARTVLIQVVLVTAGSAVALFVVDFTDALLAFLSVMVVVFTPWAGVFLCDMWLRRARFDITGLYDREGGTYRYTRGFHRAGLTALVAGTALSALAADSVLWVGPLAAALGADLSLLGGPAAALVYYLLVRGRPAFAQVPDQPVTTTTEME
ncbi:purine-cytosine permease family protein [Nocardiopsis valliformis]|uniref:purine-cytosine permease family protein n=1 Tax=Nocardiopsis valliformis TaxID=239974 RepID=UPI0003461818|nr:cytosine permease [Nocardiopsis valliformis]